MTYHVVVINGAARSGKDTFVALFKQAFAGNVVSLSTVTDVKLAAEVLGVYESEGKTDATRKLWSDIKDAWTAYNDGPFRSIVGKIGGWIFGTNYLTDDMVFFIHVREPGEIEKFKKHYGDHCTTLLIERPGMPAPENHADQEVKNYSYDLEILNSGSLADLTRVAHFTAKRISEIMAKTIHPICPMKGAPHV